MAETVFRAPGGFLPSHHYKVTLESKRSWDIKLLGHLVRYGQDAYKMGRLLDQRRFQRVPPGGVVDHILRMRGKGPWFDIDYDQIHQCFFITSCFPRVDLEEHPNITSTNAYECLWWPSLCTAHRRQSWINHALRDYRNGTVWSKTVERERPQLATPDEIRLFTEIIGFKRIGHLFINPKDLLAFWRGVSRDDLWSYDHCHLDYRMILDEEDQPISYTDFRVPRGTVLGVGEWAKQPWSQTNTFAVTVKVPDSGVQAS